eukprot:Skav217028  [mRNA]  locus=scaffold1803:338853:352289:- [translate_table: standard]
MTCSNAPFDLSMLPMSEGAQPAAVRRRGAECADSDVLLGTHFETFLQRPSETTILLYSTAPVVSKLDKDLYQIHWPDRYVPIFGGTLYDPAKERDSVKIQAGPWIWNDPNCERTANATEGIDWDVTRHGGTLAAAYQLLQIPFPESMAVIGPLMTRLENPLELDNAAVHCPFGVISVFFFFIKYLIETEKPHMGLARVYLSQLDAFSSGIHPHLLDRQEPRAALAATLLYLERLCLCQLLPPLAPCRSDWLVKDSRINALRRAMLNRLRNKFQDVAALLYSYSSLIFVVRTTDPDEADFFFVPAYSICMFEGGFFPLETIDVKYTEMVRSLPYFKRHRGRDHIFTFGSGLSASVFRSWRSEIPESIQLSPETWLFNDVVDMKEPCFNTWRDIAVPGYLHRHEILSLSKAAKPLAERKTLAVFLGRIDSSRGPHPSQGGPDVRAAIRRLKEKGQIFVAQNLTFPEMHAVMGSAKFCFVPKGKSAWSLRFFEALFANCVPVVLSDFWELPSESIVDLPSFVIKWPMDKVGDTLMDYLESISDSTLQEYMDSSKAWRCWYVYPPLLHEIAPKSPDEQMEEVCPHLDRENAFEAPGNTAGKYF